MSKKRIALSISVGSLKALCAGLGTAHVLYNLLRNDVEVVGVAGVSGGAIAAGLIGARHDQMIEDPSKTMVGIIKDLQKIKPRDIIDMDITQQIIDRYLPIISSLKKDRPFLGLIRGNALRRTFERLYGKTTIDQVKLPLVIPTSAINGSPPYDFVFTSGYDYPSETLIIKDEDDRIVDVQLKGRLSSYYSGSVPLSTIIRASTAIPGVFRPEIINIMGQTKYLCDGGVFELVPDGSLSTYMKKIGKPVDLICSVSVLGSAYGKAVLDDPNDFFDTINAIYAMNYQHTYDRRQYIQHPIIENHIKGLSLGMTETNLISQETCKAALIMIDRIPDIIERSISLTTLDRFRKVTEQLFGGL